MHKIRIFVRFFETKPIYSFMYTNKEIWNVTYPIFLGLLAQNVINVTDTAFLGHVSEVALGASAMGRYRPDYVARFRFQPRHGGGALGGDVSVCRAVDTLAHHVG